jgi:hypothetical protein
MTQGVYLPDGCIADDQVAANASIDETKLVHRHVVAYAQPCGSDVVSESKVVHVAYRSANVLQAQAVIDAAAGTGQSLTVDVKKSTAGGAWSSILTAPLSLTSAAARIPNNLVLAGAPTLAEGDLLQVVVTATGGGTDPQAEGLHVSIVVAEAGT